MSLENPAEAEIRKLGQASEAEACARMMASSEPWITLGRDYEKSIRVLTDPSREVYVGLMNGRVAGFAILNMQGAFVGYIQSVCVAPEWRNRGMGSRLMAFAEERIFKETPNVFLCVSSFNPRARKLYERLGYKIVGELEDYLVSGHSEILMRKTLGPLGRHKKK